MSLQGGLVMDARQAARTLEVIRTLMERTCQYQLLTARAGLAAGCLAGLGSLLFLRYPNGHLLDPDNCVDFVAVWSLVFLGSLFATLMGTVMRGRERGERVWSRQARAVLLNLAPSLFAALALTGYFVDQGKHLWLPGVWMMCYGQGALATSAYAPPSIRWLGVAFLPLGALTLWLGPDWATPMMGLVFGLGHIGLGVYLLIQERRESGLRIHRSVA
jgi:hypothetical protein